MRGLRPDLTGGRTDEEDANRRCPMTPGDCGVVWCDVTNPHGLHEQTLGTWLGCTPGLREPRTIQLVVSGHTGMEVLPSLTVVTPRTLRQETIELSWTDAVQIAVQVELAAGRFRESV